MNKKEWEMLNSMQIDDWWEKYQRNFHLEIVEMLREEILKAVIPNEQNLSQESQNSEDLSGQRQEAPESK